MEDYTVGIWANRPFSDAAWIAVWSGFWEETLSEGRGGVGQSWGEGLVPGGSK